VTSTLYAELRSPRVHPVYPARLTRRARSVPARTSASLRPRALLVPPPTFSLRTSASSAPLRYPPPFPLSPLATRHFCLTPLFVALPYVSAAGPLYTAFTHLHGGAIPQRTQRLRVIFPFLRTFALTYRLSALLSTACRLLPLSLQRFHPSFPLFSAAYRHFLQIRGVPPLASHLSFYVFKAEVPHVIS
jgi:hypothetical protein